MSHMEDWYRRLQERNAVRQPWDLVDDFGRPKVLAWWYVMQDRPELSFGFLCLPSDYCEYRMLGAGGAEPDEHPWKSYRIYLSEDRAHRAHLIFRETA